MVISPWLQTAWMGVGRPRERVRCWDAVIALAVAASRQTGENHAVGPRRGAAYQLPTDVRDSAAECR